MGHTHSLETGKSFAMDLIRDPLHDLDFIKYEDQEGSGSGDGCELDQAKKWAGAFLGATLVTSCALGSICLIPCRHSRFYLMLSNCLVALAISTASGASFFQLAPSALGLDDSE